MGRMVGMVHTLCPNVRLFNELVSEIIPGVKVVHLVDEGLSPLSGKKHHERIIRRLRILSSLAEESGAEVIMLTCTAFGRLADEVRAMVNIPVFTVLEIIADETIELADSIGILGTHPGTLASASEIIREQAALRGKNVTVKTLLCEGAFDALKREDWNTHDRIVLKRLTELMEEVKVIVIPQPSMERVLDQAPEIAQKKPVITSARLAVQCLKDKLDSVDTSA